MQRVDDQTRAAIPAINHQLEGERFGIRRPGGFPRPLPGRPGPGGPDTGGAPGPGPDVILPPGTYGQRRSASGRVLATAVITYGQTAPAAPELPATIPIGRRITVDSVRG